MIALALLGGGCSAGQPSAATQPEQSADVACDYVIEPPGADGVAMLRGTCDAPAEGLARTLRGAESLAGARQLALGRTALAAGGIFDHCALLARLARDPRWKDGIDSAGAAGPLNDALNAAGPVAPVEAALAAHGLRVANIQAEMVLIAGSPAAGCPASPRTVPSEAQIWLMLEREAP
ncbi:hypothetical protein D1610_04790 [Sphingomonas gilva]|uniref:Uncharacterized protein n=1 Tax=Sphingomonas gilva TaxID=2305907 RepID=A0A396RVY9_9SPHN|nr:hypothetical protein D1610_04790 [Sphingomonas gilva]